MIRVLLADDHKILRQGLAGLLREEKDIELSVKRATA
jgi:DNA-binding NarL/FixJ family response regulator